MSSPLSDTYPVAGYMSQLSHTSIPPYLHYNKMMTTGWILRSKEPTIPQVMKFCSVANEPTVTTASPFIEMRYFISAVLA